MSRIPHEEPGVVKMASILRTQSVNHLNLKQGNESQLIIKTIYVLTVGE